MVGLEGTLGRCRCAIEALRARMRAIKNASGALKGALSRGGRTVEPFVRGDGHAQCARETLEAGLDDMMAVVGIEIFNMQADTGMHREGLEPFLEKFRVHLAEL